VNGVSLDEGREVTRNLKLRSLAAVIAGRCPTG
jgi:hypothetical protein